MAIATNDTNTKEKAANFLEEIIQESIAKGDTRVQTRFPPEPNGYLHIGHAKSICINFGLAKKYGGKCNLRFDDTNPVKEDVEYVDSIKRDIRWLGFDWALERYASDYFDQLYDWAVVLIKKGLAYVDDQTQEEIRLTRGTVSEPGKESPWRNRSVEENLAFFAALFGVGVGDNYDLIAPIYRQIEPFRRRRAGKLSGGMKQKLALCCALIHRPAVLLLDEPTTGVDAVSRSEFWAMLAELRSKGISMLVSTPYMDEARRCDRIALCYKGRILRLDTPAKVVSQYDAPLFALSGDNMYGLLTAARRLEGVVACYPFGAAHHLVADTHFSAEAGMRRLAAEGFSRVTIRPVEADIEDVFIKLMGHE